MTKFILLNSTQNYNHLGCFYTVSGLKNLLLDAGWSCILESDVNNYDLDFVRKILEADHSVWVVINGEGTFHDDQEYSLYLLNLVSKYADRTVILNSQMRHMSESQVEILKRIRLVQVRTRYDEKWCITSDIQSVWYCPDMIFYSGLAGLRYQSCNRGYVVYTDSHSNNISIDLHNLYRNDENSIWLNFHYLSPHNKISKYDTFLRRVASVLGVYSKFELANWEQRFSISKLLEIVVGSNYIVTGRYHMACLAMILGKPFVYASSNTSKIKDLSDDFNLGTSLKSYSEKESFLTEMDTIDIFKFYDMDDYRKKLLHKLMSLC